MTRPQAIQVAREMWANGEGWGFTDISRYLAKHGIPVSRQTVRLWVDSDALERDRAASRRRKRELRGSKYFTVLDDDAKARLGGPERLTPDLLLALRLEDGLPYSAIAKVATRLLGTPMTTEQVRYRLLELGAPKNEKKSANATAQARRRQMREAA